MGVKAYSARDVQELNYIESPLPLFVFGDERLRFAELGGDIGLGQPRGFSFRQQQTAEPLVFPTKERIGHRIVAKAIRALDDA
jgi:hypothetical protein